jgi:excisionase family DNA binding protein
MMIRQQETGRLYTPAEAAEILRIRESWLRAKATARAIPCTFIGKHLRFSDDDITQIMAEGARQPVTRGRRTRR